MKAHTLSSIVFSCVVVLATFSSSGCESMQGGLAGAGAGAAAGGIAKAAGADTDLSVAIGVGVGLATAIVVDVIEQRQASETERAEAKAKADEQLEGLDEKQRSEMKKEGTYVAVPVNEGKGQAGTSEVMIVDPETGDPVDDTVYVVDTSKTDVDSGEKVDLGGYDAIYVY